MTTKKDIKKEKLSKVQECALKKFENGEWHTAYQCQESLATLNSLLGLGYLRKQEGLGSRFSPRTEIRFQRRYL